MDRGLDERAGPSLAVGEGCRVKILGSPRVPAPARVLFCLAHPFPGSRRLLTYGPTVMAFSENARAPLASLLLYSLTLQCKNEFDRKNPAKFFSATVIRRRSLAYLIADLHLP